MSFGSSRGLAGLCACLVILGGCRRAPAPPEPTEPEIQTIEKGRDVPPLPMSSDTEAGAQAGAVPPLVDLPFAPAISMDPVDGGKVSIRPDTPVAEFEDRVYYFRSEENRQAFLRNPEKYATGSLSRY